MDGWSEDEVIEKCYFFRVYQPRGRVSSDTQMHVACALADALVQKTFFGQLLYTSAVAMVTQVCDPAEARDWLERSDGEEGRRTLLEGYRGVRGVGQTQR